MGSRYLNKYGANISIFSMILDSIKNLNGYSEIPIFYQNIIKVWIAIGVGQRNQLFWENKFIMNKSKVL